MDPGEGVGLSRSESRAVIGHLIRDVPAAASDAGSCLTVPRRFPASPFASRRVRPYSAQVSVTHSATAKDPWEVPLSRPRPRLTHRSRSTEVRRERAKRARERLAPTLLGIRYSGIACSFPLFECADEHEDERDQKDQE
jgi:hypothetical protein